MAEGGEDEEDARRWEWEWECKGWALGEAVWVADTHRQSMCTQVCCAALCDSEFNEWQ